MKPGDTPLECSVGTVEILTPPTFFCGTETHQDGVFRITAKAGQFRLKERLHFTAGNDLGFLGQRDIDGVGVGRR